MIKVTDVVWEISSAGTPTLLPPFIIFDSGVCLSFQTSWRQYKIFIEAKWSLVIVVVIISSIYYRHLQHTFFHAKQQKIISVVLNHYQVFSFFILNKQTVDGVLGIRTWGHRMAAHPNIGHNWVGFLMLNTQYIASIFTKGFYVLESIFYITRHYLHKTNREQFGHYRVLQKCVFSSVWPDKNRQMSSKVAQKWFH